MIEPGEVVKREKHEAGVIDGLCAGWTRESKWSVTVFIRNGRESGRRLPHSKTSRIIEAGSNLRQFLQCAVPCRLRLGTAESPCSKRVFALAAWVMSLCRTALLAI